MLQLSSQRARNNGCHYLWSKYSEWSRAHGASNNPNSAAHTKKEECRNCAVIVGRRWSSSWPSTHCCVQRFHAARSSQRNNLVGDKESVFILGIAFGLRNNKSEKRRKGSFAKKTNAFWRNFQIGCFTNHHTPKHRHNNLHVPTSTVAHRAKRVAIERSCWTNTSASPKIQPCLVILLHRANDVSDLLARLRCMASTRLMIAHHEAATRPMDHLMVIFLMAMRNANCWNSANVTRTNLLAYVLTWIVSQVQTVKATAKTESKYGCGVISRVPGAQWEWKWRSPTAPLASWVWVGVGGALSKLPLHTDDKAALETPSAFLRRDPSSEPSPNGRKRRLRCLVASRQHHTHTLPFNNNGADPNADFLSSRNARQLSPRLS